MQQQREMCVEEVDDGVKDKLLQQREMCVEVDDGVSEWRALSADGVVGRDEAVMQPHE